MNTSHSSKINMIKHPTIHGKEHNVSFGFVCYCMAKVILLQTELLGGLSMMMLSHSEH